MIYNLLLPYANSYHIANLMTYLSFRSFSAFFLSFVFCLIFGERIINLLKNIQLNGQPIRIDGPDTHISKSGTPTMGGVMILAATIISTIIFSDLQNPYVWIMIFTIFLNGLIGFFDDYLKIKHNNSKGLSGKRKLFFQIIVASIAIISTIMISPDLYKTKIIVPIFKNILIDLGFLYLFFGIFVIIGSSNAVNLTDGLDGLAIMPIAISFAVFGLIAYLVGSAVYAPYLFIPHIIGVQELVILSASIIGAGLGFLWYNSQPAAIFMGDTGSLSLGAGLGLLSVITKHELTLAIVGGVFVLETFSVIIQVLYFKYSGGKRIFRMAPLHHHFEKLGWSESKVVIRFWIISIICAIIGIIMIKIR